MSIESKHAYRFGYLKSEKWKGVRLEALVREKAKCQICGDESISNDAHHVWYPESIWETTEKHLVVLCRGCHEFVHAMLPECKTDDEEKGRTQWIKLRNAILAWRQDKQPLFKNYPDIQEASDKLTTVKSLRDAYLSLKAEYKEQAKVIEDYQKRLLIQMTNGTPIPETNPTMQIDHEEQVNMVLGLVEKWATSYHRHATCGKKKVEPKKNRS